MIRAVIIGCGLVAGYIDDETPASMAHLLPRSHAAALRAHPKVELVAVCDVNRETLKRFGEKWSVSQLYQDQKQMLNDIQPDLVCVATPAVFHAEACENAVRAGARAIYCEKALASSITEAKALYKLLHEKAIAFNLGVSRRFEASFRKAKQLISEGRLGEVSAAVGYSTGPLMRTHSHTFDTLAMLLGDPVAEAVSGKVAAKTSEDPIQDPLVEHATVKFGGGVVGMIVPATKHYEFEVFGEKGNLRSRNGGLEWELFVGSGPRNYIKVPFPPVDLVSPTSAAIDELVQFLIGQRDDSTSAPISIAMANMEMLVGLVESSFQSGSEVQLPSESKKHILSN